MSTVIPSKVTLDIKEEIKDFLYEEAFLLDNRMYNEWLDLLDENISYKMPLRETVQGVGVNDIVEDMSFFDETKTSLTTRVKRLYTKSAWVENPATRQRHYISNIKVRGTSNPNEFSVRSYFLYKRTRGSNHEIEQMTGQRYDILRKENDEWKIISRTIYADQAVITTMNMSMFL
ncbi:3-phenylpropionate/cinnamic acid dioxygenase subunit beta [Bacillus sp. Marseille-P3661]|uniref:3-phenylpropionate/cinnamic acid dioxygenase subunit beta n=1 Tax=Bacillus sp. Marseille-P3661 TaxID=1936234 RepID=UPI000C8397FB|nr:3-phenylpropionate/cinnamic acid dioxygenase subunit beta [Bacillus sp. Marseille-P3661]